MSVKDSPRIRHAFNSVSGWGKDRAKLSDMAGTCLKLSKQLRQPGKKGEKPCDIVIALTHAQYVFCASF